MNIFEKINKNYYDLPVLEVMSDFPNEFMRMFMDEFERVIFKIDTEIKQNIMDSLRRDLRDGRNNFFDSFNRREYEFSSKPFMDALKASKQKTYRDYEVQIVFNVIGTKLKYTIKGPNTSSDSDRVMDLIHMTGREFLNKFIRLVNKVYKMPNRRYNGTDDMSDPDLFEQDPEFTESLNRLASRFLMGMSSTGTYLHTRKEIRFKPNYNFYIPNYETIKYLKLPESFSTNFQKEMFDRGIKYILSFLNKQHLWAERFDVNDYSLQIVVANSSDGDKLNREYRSSTYRQLQDHALKGFDPVFEKFIESEGKKKIEINSRQDFHKFITRRVFDDSSSK